MTGATRPELLARLRELMPHAIFLLPGVGAQGGGVDDLAAAFEPHPAAAWCPRRDRSWTRRMRARAAAEEMRRAAWRSLLTG